MIIYLSIVTVTKTKSKFSVNYIFILSAKRLWVLRNTPITWGSEWISCWQTKTEGIQSNSNLRSLVIALFQVKICDLLPALRLLISQTKSRVLLWSGSITRVRSTVARESRSLIMHEENDPEVVHSFFMTLTCARRSLPEYNDIEKTSVSEERSLPEHDTSCMDCIPWNVWTVIPGKI